MRPHIHRVRRWAPVLALITLLLLPATVSAHAELVETTPADGATVEGSPSEIVAVFSAALEDNSSLQLRNEAGDTIAEGGLDPDDAERLVISPVLELAPGEYEVRWTAATDDGHVERDTWTFTVVTPASPDPTATPSPTLEPTATSGATATPSPTLAPSATASSSPVATATPSASASPSTSASPIASASASPLPSPSGGDETPTGDSTSDAILPIIVGLAMVALVGGVLLTRRNRTTPPA